MSKQGDDCYFYFYSTCTKGDNCSFRHCEAALGNETVCTLWQEGRCFRNVCRFRHMEIDKKRAEIPCYWEKQPVGCQKANCAFHHAKGRYIDGVFLPPSKNQLSAEGEETKTPVQQPAEEGQNGLRMISTRKASATTAKQEDGLNFGIKTLEEIKLQKMKEKTKRHGEGPSRSSLPPVDSMIFPAPEKENVRTVVRTVTLSTEEGEEPVVRLDLAEKQGKRKASVADVSALPVKRSLAERLGKKVEVPGNADKAPKRVQVPKSVKERLGLPSQRTSTAKGKAAKPKGEIHVKTLEEIRRERALQRRETQAKAQAECHGKTEDPSAGARPAPAGRIKTFSEALAEKKNNRLVEEKKKAGEFHTKIKIQGEPKKQCVLTLSGPSKVQSKEPAGKVKPEGEVRVKTLEEIKREKALRMQQSGGNVRAPPAQPGPAPAGQKSLRNTKLSAPEKEEKKTVELNRPFPKIYSVTDVQPTQQSATRTKFQVKSIDERLWEKWQLREQQEKLRKEAAAVPSTAGFFATVPLGKEAAQFQEQEAKTNFNMFAKPWDGKVASPKKKALKRKAPGSFPSAVAAVKPRTAFDTDTMGPPAKKAAVAVPAMLEHVPATRLEENPRNRPEAHLGSQAESAEPREFSSSTSASSQREEARTRRLSSTGNAPLSVDEDFEMLLWEISGGRLEAELDLDAGKDEDDLLLELSKMIDD